MRATRRSRLGAGLVALLLCVGCGRAIDRPLHGASPGAELPTPVVPPTLAASSRPARAPATPSPSPAPAAPPIVRALAPVANGRVPAGAPVAVSAVLVGRGADLDSASLAVNGGEVAAEVEKRSAREWSIRAVRPLGPGSHTARVVVRDAHGAVGGYSWQFAVGGPDPRSAEGQPTPPRP